MASEQAPFLSLDEKSSDPEDLNSTLPTRSRRSQWLKPLLLHSALIAIYTLTSILIVRTQRTITILPPTSIDNLHIAYTPSIFHRLNATPYAGEPSPEIDAAWDTLLKPMHISVTQEELERDNQESVALPEKGGYLGWMGVFHELHCIVSTTYGVPNKVYPRFAEYCMFLSQRMLREWTYRDYYHQNLSNEEKSHLGSHIGKAPSLSFPHLQPPYQPQPLANRPYHPRPLFRIPAAILNLPRRRLAHNIPMAPIKVPTHVQRQ